MLMIDRESVEHVALVPRLAGSFCFSPQSVRTYCSRDTGTNEWFVIFHVVSVSSHVIGSERVDTALLMMNWCINRNTQQSSTRSKLESVVMPFHALLERVLNQGI